jgi:hypothetical protein
MTMDIDPMEASRYRHASFCASIPGGIGAAEIQQFATQAEQERLSQLLPVKITVSRN